VRTARSSEISVLSAIRSATDALRRSGSPTPRLDAELLVGHVLGRDRSWLLAHGEATVDDRPLRELIRRRASGEPIAYIRGFKDWHALQIRTDARALIPRPETELVADTAGDEIAARLATAGRTLVAWDLATGSGAIATVLALRFADVLRAGRLRLVATDLSADALTLARENLAAHGVDQLVELAKTDLLEEAGATIPRPDVVAANLPYVASDEVDRRVGSLGFEPRIALDGGVDGLVVLRRLMGQLTAAVAPGGVVLLETGVGQANEIRALAPAGIGFEVVPDLAGLDRVVRLALP
jgi:release factor glutamine methyltransferase